MSDSDFHGQARISIHYCGDKSTKTTCLYLWKTSTIIYKYAIIKTLIYSSFVLIVFRKKKNEKWTVTICLASDKRVSFSERNVRMFNSFIMSGPMKYRMKNVTYIGGPRARGGGGGGTDLPRISKGPS